MTADDRYELLDCGGGRRLEAVGPRRLDRPAPGAVEAPRRPADWARAARYEPGRGWVAPSGGDLPDGPVPVRLAGVTLLASLGAGGEIGLFPEHATQARWLTAAIGLRESARPEVTRAPAAASEQVPPAVLHLFGHTGLLTLVAARAGAAVAHLDGSRPAVDAARRNAEASELAGRPIRWLLDDAAAFVRREGRRSRRYDGIVLDPPSFGHGGAAHRGTFRIDRDLPSLLAASRAIATDDAFWLLSAHSVGWDGPRLADALADALGVPTGRIVAARLELRARSGAVLDLGAVARFDPLDRQPR